MEGQITVARDVHAGPHPDALRQVVAEGTAAAIWQRDRSAAFAEWIDALAPAQLPRLRTTLQFGAVTAAIHAACDTAGTPRGTMRDWLAEDAAALALMFGAIMDAPMLRLRMDVIDRNACTRFHLDRVPARLLCTYRGSGTEYGVARPREEPAQIERVPTGAAAVFRGALWSDGEATELLHRSPPVAGMGETRLLLVLDVADSPQPGHASR